MVQLPVENEGKRGIRKMEGERGKGGERGQGLPALKCFTALAEAGLEVMGYPFAHTPLPSYIILPPLHLALRAPPPLCSANQAHSFLKRGGEGVCMRV